MGNKWCFNRVFVHSWKGTNIRAKICPFDGQFFENDKICLSKYNQKHRPSTRRNTQALPPREHDFHEILYILLQVFDVAFQGGNLSRWWKKRMLSGFQLYWHLTEYLWAGQPASGIAGGTCALFRFHPVNGTESEETVVLLEIGRWYEVKPSNQATK